MLGNGRSVRDLADTPPHPTTPCDQHCLPEGEPFRLLFLRINDVRHVNPCGSHVKIEIIPDVAQRGVGTVECHPLGDTHGLVQAVLTLMCGEV